MFGGMFSKQQPAEIKSCPKGSVHAWEHNGVLYHTEQARARAIREAELGKFERRLYKFLIGRYDGGRGARYHCHPSDISHAVDFIAHQIMKDPQGIHEAFKELDKLREEIKNGSTRSGR